MNISQPNKQPQQIVNDDKNFEIQLCFKIFQLMAVFFNFFILKFKLENK